MELLSLAGYGAAFHAFTVGFSTWARARSSSAREARLKLLAVVVAAMAGPWLLLAITGGYTSGDDVMLGASLSPFYALHMIVSLEHTTVPSTVLSVGAGASFLWTFLGLALFAAGARRARQRIEERQHALALLEQQLVETPPSPAPQPSTHG